MSLHIENFRALVQANQQKKASVTQLETSVASDLLHSITKLQTRLIEVQDELIKAQKKIIEAETVEVEMDGENWSS
jgi:uncharacterized protein YlxW (UPF0749 family)